MSKITDIFTVFIGESQIENWLLSEAGKSVLMPLLLIGCEEIITENKDEKLCAIIVAKVKRKPYNYKLYVKRNSISDTLDKIMEYSLENEEYEMCARIKKLHETINE